MSDREPITFDDLPANCPDCGGELIRDGALLASNPPQQEYHCNECGNVYRTRAGEPRGHTKGVAQAKMLQQEFWQWLKDNHAALSVCMVTPTGERVSMASAIRPGLGDWLMQIEVVPRNDANN